MHNPNYFSVDRISGSGEISRTYESENYKYSQTQSYSFSYYSTAIGDALCSGRVRDNGRGHGVFGHYNQSGCQCNDNRNYGPFGHIRQDSVHHYIGHGQQHQRPNEHHDRLGFGNFGHYTQGCGCNNDKPQSHFGWNTANTTTTTTNNNGCSSCGTTTTTKPTPQQSCGCSGGTTGSQSKKADIYAPIDMKAWFSDGKSPSYFGEYKFEDNT